MVEGSDSLSQLPGVLQDYFVVENNVASTRVVKAYKALDKFKRQSVGLVVSRIPLPSDLVPRFAKRAAELSQLVEISSYGLDAQGTAFLVLPVFDGKRLDEGSLESVELERRYLAGLRLVARLHDCQLVCGDLCLSALFIDRSGALKLFAGWSIFDVAGTGLPDESEEWAYCLAPEQRRGEEPTRAVDVFALGVIGYRFFTGEYPRFDESGRVLSQPLTLKPSAPGWLDDVLAQALAPSAADRLQTASDLVQAISQWKESAAARESLPAPLEVPPIVPPSRISVEAVPIELRALPGTAKEPTPAPKPSRTQLPLIMKASLVAVLSFLGLWMGFSGSSFFDHKEQPASLAVSPGDVSKTLVEQGAHGDKGKYIEELAMSGDPLAHDILIRMFKEAQSEDVATKVWEGLLARARRNGLVRSSDYVRAWANTEARSPERKATEETSLRLLDPALPMNTRVELLEVARALDSKFSVGLAASLALDLKKLDPFQPVFLQSAAEALAVVPGALRGRSTGALMLATPEVSTLYADDIIDDAKIVSDGDIMWLLPELTKRQLPGVKRISEVAAVRALVAPAEVIFLQILGRKVSIPARVQTSLVACALGQASKTDVVSFAGWYDTDAEKALWALVVSTKDPDLGAKAYDALAAKPLLTQGISELYDYVRSTYYADRAVVGVPVAALALENVLSDAEFSRAFEGLDRLPKSKELIKVVLKGPSIRALREVMGRYASLVERMQLLDLVRHSDPTVRAAAVEALKDANDVAILKILTDAYANEADPIVRAAYEKHISTIRERVGK